MLSKNGEIRRDEHCFDYAGGESQLGMKDKIVTYNCHSQGGNQFWSVHEGLIKHRTGYCVEMTEDNSGLVMNKCNRHNVRQLWSWTKRDSTTKKK